ncbi:MAG TPA: hypothetical protein PKH10_04215 [bacterium]|nr:hypothetical protein [bacterium]
MFFVKFLLPITAIVLFFACSSPQENPMVDGDQIVMTDHDQLDQADQSDPSDQTDDALPPTDDDTEISDDYVKPVTCGNNVTDTGEACDGDAKNCTDISGGYTGGVAVCKEDCSGYDTTACQGVADDDNAGADDEMTDADSAPDLTPDVDMNVWPECTQDGECGSSTRACYQGICRDKCTLYINECDWKPSGNICSGGLCVECLKDGDCPGTRYTCDTTKLICVDKPFDPSKTKIGVFYHTWHCPSATEVHDVSKCLEQNSWPDWPSDPNVQTSFWWAEPQDGYYCLTNNTALLTKHAEMLRDMGTDFVFVDVTNHNYNTSSLCINPEGMIIQPFTTLVNVWKNIPGAPKIVPWVPVSDCPTYFQPNQCTHPADTYIVYTLLDILKDTGMLFEYQGKPLLLITENSTYPVSETKLATLSATYTIRKMWAFEGEGTEKWSYLERCDADPLETQPCFQRISKMGGVSEQFPIATAYGADYMSHTSTATPKHQGKTFRKQFQTLLDNPEIPIATITGWNEWIVGRWKCGAPACDCGNAFDAEYGCFLDQYTYEYNRDIEPAKNDPLGDYYYRLVQSCIALFRAGGRCDANHAGDLCCKDYSN